MANFYTDNEDIQFLFKSSGSGLKDRDHRSSGSHPHKQHLESLREARRQKISLRRGDGEANADFGMRSAECGIGWKLAKKHGDAKRRLGRKI